MKKNGKSLKEKYLNKENLIFVFIALILCMGVVVSKVKTSDIPLHDGDVLVDSQNVATEPGTEPATGSSDDEKGNKDNNAKSGENSDKSRDFEKQRASLELERNDIIAQYDKTISSAGSKGEKDNAIARKEQLTKYMEQEVTLENLIKAKNLPQCLVIISEKQITVTVDDKSLNQTTVAKICNLVMTETGRTADQIIIQSKY